MKRFIYILVFTHLALIALTIFHVLDNVYTKNSVIERSSSFLCSINYSVWRYGFFSPDVGNSNEIEIKTYDVDGGIKTLSTLNNFNFDLSNADLAMRFYGFKVYNVADTLVQDLCARSVATRIMNTYPGTWKVSYTIRSIRYPTLSGYLQKQPVKTKLLYTTDFVLDY